MMQLVRQPLPDRVSEREACDVLDLCRNSVRTARARYHFMGPPSPYRRKRAHSCQPRALSEEERNRITEVLTSDECADQPPAQVPRGCPARTMG